MEGGIKIVFLGESGVGKTTIVTRYATGSVPEVSAPTVGAAFVSKETVINGKSYSLLIWDTAGQELYRGLAPMYYRNADIAIITFDITRKKTFEAVTYWLEQLRENSEQDVIIILCGNKCDRENREIENGEKFAADNDLLYCETSAKSGSGLDRLFQLAIMAYDNNVSAVPTSSISQTVDIDIVPEKKKGGCC